MKRIISVILAFVLGVGALPFVLPELLSGAEGALDFKYGDDCSWYYDTNTDVFSVTGTGSTYDYGGMNRPPWSGVVSRFGTAVINEGITRLGAGALGSAAQTREVYLPSTLECIDCYFTKSVTNINIPENNSLKYVNVEYIQNTAWFKSQPDGPVYLGKVLIGYNGDITAETVVNITDGTVGIAKDALYNRKELANINYPETIEYVGYRAFENTAWLSAQPYGPMYIGKSLYTYIGNVSVEEYDFTVREGTVSISDWAFYNKKIMTYLHIPESLEYIGDSAFNYVATLSEITIPENSRLKHIGGGAFIGTKINTFNLPQGLEYIGDNTFGSRIYRKIYIPSSVNHIGELAQTGNSNGDTFAEFTVSPENKKYSSDEQGNLYNKDKSVLIRAAAVNAKTDLTVSDTVTEIYDGACRNIRLMNKITLPDGLKKIGKEALAMIAYDDLNTDYVIDFGYSEPEIGTDLFNGDIYLTSIIVRSMNLVFPEGAFSSVKNETFTVYLMLGSAMQTYCETYGINYEFLDYYLQLAEINNALSIAQGLDRSLYTADSLAALDSAVSQINLDVNGLTQEQVDEWTGSINAALSALKYLPADFTAIGEALARARSINRSLYTADSLLALDTLALSVDYGADITRQTEIDSLAADINAAVDSLVYREADYSAVNNAVSRAVAVNRNQYTEQSLANLDAALQNIEYGLDITYQNKVNAFAESIELAVNALVAKPADYKDVEEAIRRADSVNRDYYTAESLAAVDNAIAAVDYSLTFANQQSVAQYALAINAAVDSLVYLPADYTAVDSAINRAGNIDRIMWGAASLAELDQSIDSVDRSLNITQQAVVDAYAQNITDKIDSLEYAAVTLRNDTHGVIVGATAKEIYPLTSLTVEKLDPSDITGANFAVGGKVKTALYYDISLILNSEKIQPGGEVTVKIRIPDGVSPEKCKVYHVTDDPVDPLVKFTSAVDGSYIVFETDHFSEFAVLEIENIPEGIVITALPDKTVYGKGEAFDPKGMIITAFYSNGTNARVTDYDVSVDTSTAGTVPLTVYYTMNGVTKSVSTVITVKDDSQENPENPGDPGPHSEDPDDEKPKPDDPQTLQIKLKAPVNTTVDYRTKVTVIVSADNLPDGCKIVLSSGGKTVASGEGTVRYYIGEIKNPEVISARVVDKSGNMVTGSDGKAVKSEFTVNVNNGFFTRIIAFFKGLFNLLPEKTIEP